MYLGIDIGSSSSKAVILGPEKERLAAQVENLGTGTKGAAQALELAYAAAGLRPEDIRRTVATGYGRLTFSGADKQITEITCHAKGARFLLPELHTIVDIGGQDTKAIRLSPTGLVDNFVMNDKCAAGTGRFLEVMARVLGCSLEELSGLAAAGEEPVSISNLCTVFAESEVISLVGRGVPRQDIAYGILESITDKVAAQCSQLGSQPRYFLTGGLCQCPELVRSLERKLQAPLETCPDARYAGAIGAALFAQSL